MSEFIQQQFDKNDNNYNINNDDDENEILFNGICDLNLKDYDYSEFLNNREEKSIINFERIYAQRAKKRLYECEIYNYEKLNEKQKRIFNYIEERERDGENFCILVQAPPGTGKTFTMMTIAYNWEPKVCVVIYKKDLLSQFAYTKNYLLTVCKFFMCIFNLKYHEWVSLDKQLCRKLNCEQFLNILIGLLRRAVIPKCFHDKILIMDEYTIVPKLILYLFLLLCKIYNLKVVFCGDKNQLQNIHNSKYTVEMSSFEIVLNFSTKMFDLSKNERCLDENFNEIIKFVSKYSCEKLLDKFAFCFLSAIFSKKMLTPSQPEDTILASTHSTLAEAIHKKVLKHNICCSFYFINGMSVKSENKQNIQGKLIANEMYQPIVRKNFTNSNNVDKYLPYIPLIINAPYYVQTFSEKSICFLANYDSVKKIVYMKRNLEETDDKKFLSFHRETCNDVLFPNHLYWILNGGLGDSFLFKASAGKIYNYPIYPAFLVTKHMCQGRTLTGNVHIILSKTQSNYQSTYVALSRVREKKQINRIQMPNGTSFLFSALINFASEFINKDELTADDLIEKFENENNYKFFNLLSFKDKTCIETVKKMICLFFSKTEKTHRTYILNSLIKFSSKIKPEYINNNINNNNNKKIKNNNNSNNLMKLLLKFKNVIFNLSLLQHIECKIWIHEFLQCTEIFLLLNDECRNFSFVTIPLFDENLCKTLRNFDFNVNETSKMYLADFLNQLNEQQQQQQQQVQRYKENLFLKNFLYESSINQQKPSLIWLIEILKVYLLRKFLIKGEI